MHYVSMEVDSTSDSLSIIRDDEFIFELRLNKIHLIKYLRIDVVYEHFYDEECCR